MYVLRPMDGVTRARTSPLLLWLLARDWSGLAIAALIALIGALLVPLSPILAGAIELTALGLGGGAVSYLVRRAAAKRRFPPRGVLVNAGSCRLHVLAEGSGPSVVWFAGAHVGGYAVAHLHRAARDECRSILVDRPGTGWSDVGPFPRTTAREAEEVVRALDAAGEEGPFIFVGHSFGGLLAANIARRYPERTLGVVLLDATPPDTLVYGPRLGALSAMRATTLKQAFRRMFGLEPGKRPPAKDPVSQQVERMLGEDQVAGHAIEANVGNALATWSIFHELSGPGFAGGGWNTIVYDGDLGDLPVVVVTPEDPIERDNPEIQMLPEFLAASEADRVRMRRFFALNRFRYLATSSNSRRLPAPAGSGHNFPFFHPEVVIEALRSVIGPQAAVPTRETSRGPTR